MNFLKKVLTIFVAILLPPLALSVVIKHNTRGSGIESVSESEQYSESKTAGGEIGSEKESEKGSENESESVSSPSESGTKPAKKVERIVLNETKIIF